MGWIADWSDELQPNLILTVLAIIGVYHICKSIRRRPVKDRSTQTFHASNNLKQAAISSLFGDDTPVTNWPKEARRQRQAANRAGRQQPVTIAQHKETLVGVFPSEDLTIDEIDAEITLRVDGRYARSNAPPASA